MLTIANLPTQDKYVDALTLGPVPSCRQIKYVVANKAALARVWPKLQSGTIPALTDELLITPETNVITNAVGIQFRSALPGVPAQVIAQLVEPGDPLFGSGTPFAATLSGGGGVTPGVSSVQIQKNGALIGTEPTLDFIDGSGGSWPWAINDDVANARVTISPPNVGIVRCVYANAAQVVVSNTAAEVEIFQNLLSIPADAMGAQGFARIQFHGGITQNTGVPQNLPRWRGYFGGVLQFDTGFGGGGVGIASGGLAGLIGELMVYARGSRLNQLETIWIQGGSQGAGADAVSSFVVGNPGTYELRNGGAWAVNGGAEIGGSQNTANPLVVQLTVQLPLASPNYVVIKEYVSIETTFMG